MHILVLTACPFFLPLYLMMKVEIRWLKPGGFHDKSCKNKKTQNVGRGCVTVVLTLSVDIVVRKLSLWPFSFFRKIYEVRQSASYKRGIIVLKGWAVDPTATRATYKARLKQLLEEFFITLLEILSANASKKKWRESKS